MLEGLKRWLGGGGSGASKPGLEDFNAWAAQRQLVVRSPREGEGVIIDGKQGNHPWRMEWGASQRSYVDGNELRIRAEVRLPSDLQMLVMNKPLQESLEKAVFDQYVEGVQTRIDNQTPPEMRWLVMFAKLSSVELGRLRERFSGVSSAKPWLQQWLDGPLTQALMACTTEAATPMVLMVGRGRLTLRIAMPEPDPREFEPMIKLYEIALRELRRVAGKDDAPAAPPTAPPSEI